MKYLFYVHSNITYLIAKGIIQHESINENDCRFLIARGYQTNSKIKSLALNSEFNLDQDFEVGQNIFKLYKTINKLDSIVDGLTNNSPFELFIFHTDKNFNHLLISHKNCISFNYMEEGLGSYISHLEIQKRKDKRKSLILNLLFWISFKGRCPRKKIHLDLNHIKFNKIYASASNCYPDINKKEIISIPNEGSSIKLTTLLLFQPFYETNELHETEFHKIHNELFGWFIKKGFLEIHYKFHPWQKDSKNILTTIMKEFSPQLRFIELGIKENVDQISINNNINLIVINSSTAIYVNNPESKIFSYGNLCVKIFPNFQKTMDHTPKFLMEKMTQITL